MWRRGHIERRTDLAAVARRVYLPEAYREAAGAMEVAIPDRDWKVEGIHDAGWTLTEASRPLAISADLSKDRRVFDAARRRDHLAELELANPRVALVDVHA